MVTSWPLQHPLSQTPYRRPLSLGSPNPLSHWSRPPTFQQNWRLPSNFRSGHQLLYRYLPFLVQVAYESNITLEEASKQLACASGGIEENGSFCGLDAMRLLACYQFIIQIVESSPNHHVASANIRTRLNVSALEAGRYHGQHSLDRYYRTLLSFRAYAEISRQTQSRCLATVLSEFFLTHAPSLLVNDFDILVLWSHSIHRSAMDFDERDACLALIVGNYPELPDELRMMRSRPAELLYPVLASIANDVGVGDARFRGRTRYRPRGWGAMEGDHALGPSIPRRIGGRWESFTPSPERGLLGDRGSVFEPEAPLIVRPRSAPGLRSIARQADRVMESAEDTMAEAANLKSLTMR